MSKPETAIIAADSDTPALVLEYTDPVEGFKGWFVRDRVCNRLCAGGMRVQRGLTRDRLVGMARNMTLKMQIADLRVDGAKSGIDYDPGAPGRNEAVARFLRALKPYVETSYSMGPDLNMEMDDLERIAARSGIVSVKMAVAAAQGWDLDYFFRRYAILKQETGGLTLGRMRAGSGVAAAVLAVLKHLGTANTQARVAIQGFGNLGKATAKRLHDAGVNICAVADVDKCLVAPPGQGLDIPELVRSTGPLPGSGPEKGISVKPPAAILDLQCDVLVPAAVEDAVPPDKAAELQVRAVVPGANLAVSPESRLILRNRDIIVIPDFLAGCGGSLSMAGLFGPAEHPSPAEVLGHVEKKIMQLVARVMTRSERKKVSPTQAALDLCREYVCHPDTRPYGRRHTP